MNDNKLLSLFEYVDNLKSSNNNDLNIIFTDITNILYKYYEFKNNTELSVLKKTILSFYKKEDNNINQLSSFYAFKVIYEKYKIEFNFPDELYDKV